MQPSAAKGNKLVWIPQIVYFFLTLFPAPTSDEDSADDDIPTELKKISLTTSFRQPKVNHLIDLNQKMSSTKEKLPRTGTKSSEMRPIDSIHME